jgi:hypothetical protein
MKEDVMNASDRTFESKRDLWVVVLLWVCAAFFVVAGIGQLGDPGSPAAKGLILLGLVAMAALLLWLLYGTRYIVGPQWLLIRSGPFRFRVPLGAIDSVTPTHLPLSSPACSLDRLRIRYRGGRRVLMVSPEDKRGFLDALARHAAHLRRDGNRLVPAGDGNDRPRAG